jgi:hypothetical protein
LTDALEVRHSVLQMHSPAGVSRYQYKVLVGYRPLPRLENPLIVVPPVLPESVHGFPSTAGEVQVAYREYSHRG